MDWTEIQPSGPADHGWQCVAADQSGKNLLAVIGYGGAGEVWLSADGGTTWTQKLASYTNRMWSCCAINSDGTRMIVGSLHTLPNSGRLMHSADSGATWSEARPAGDIDKAWTALAMSGSGQYIIAAALDDYVYVSEDYGSTWAKKYPTAP